MKSRYKQALGWENRADVRERHTGVVPLSEGLPQ